MKRAYQITSVVLACFSVFIIMEASGYDYMTGIGPGGGFFPLWLGIVLLGLSGLLFVNATVTEGASLPENFLPDRAGVFRIGVILGMIALVAALMKPLGFRLTMLAFLLVLLRVLGKQHFALTIAVALAGSFGVAYVFTTWLRVLLPVGFLGI